MRIAHLAAASAVALVTVGCGDKASDEAKAEDTAAAKTDVAETAIDEPQERELPSGEELLKEANENLVASEKFLKENAEKDGVVTTESGLQYLVLEESAEGGARPKPSDIVDMHFVATLKDGKEIMSSRQSGAAARFQLGEFLPGGIEGVQLMKEGDRYRFFMHPTLAFGEDGQGPIPANEAIIFDIELLNIVDPARNLAKAEKFLAENKSKKGVKTTDSGLQYEVITEGPADGVTPNDASKVKVHYVGTLVNGTEFDSSLARGEPAEFPVSGVISGWTEGLQLMSEGDKFRFFIHPELAYGANPRPGGAIGPNDALIFEVELLEVQ